MVNSVQFKKILKKDLNVNSECIYNPLNKTEIIKNPKKVRKKFLLQIIN